MRTSQFAALLASVLVIAGCGGSQKPDVAGVRQALRQSNSSYLHYPSSTWWGSPVRLQLRATRFDGDYALARVYLTPAPRFLHSQWSLLKRDSTGWHVLSTVVQESNFLPCVAPQAVMRRLAGGCSNPPANLGGTIYGPRAERSATRSELAAISAAARSHDARISSCATWTAKISTLDSRYARVDPVFPRSQMLHPHGRCGLVIGNGEFVFAHGVSGWHYVGGGSSNWPCRWGPPGAIRSLFGACALPA